MQAQDPPFQDAFIARIDIVKRRAYAYGVLRALPPRLLDEAIETIERLATEAALAARDAE